MWTYYPELLQRPVPRYTSYPTAADFTAQVGEDAYRQALQDIEPGAAISLYVHIPFCEEICWYCGCNTARSNKRARLAAYLEALHAEVMMIAGLVGNKGRVTRISFGGGSPNALQPIDFVRLLGDIMIAFRTETPLISLEIDPRHVSDDWLNIIDWARIANVSLGVQSFAPQVQEAIGRVQPLHVIQQLTTRLRDAGVRSLNFDLMYGLPHQDEAVLMETLRQAADMVPDRIALFGYAHVPSLFPRQRRIDEPALPDGKQRFAMACMGHDFLVGLGYQPVGFDHYALPHDPLARAARNGRLARNFQGFTDDGAAYLLGLGASSISRFPGLYTQNAKNAGAYRIAIAQQRLATERGIHRDASSQFHGRIINDILCHGEAMLPATLTPEQEESLEEFAQHRLISTSAGRICLKTDALPYARTIAAIFDPRMAGKIGGFSAPV